MKLAWFGIGLVVGCTQGTKAAGSGAGRSSASGSATVAACAPSGNYRLRFHSNGTDGWWLRMKVAGDSAEITEAQQMLGLMPGPIDMVVDASCGIVLTRKTRQAGDLSIRLTVDARGNVTGQLMRTANQDQGLATTQVAGVREAAPAKLPLCLHPGAFMVKLDPKPKWKLEGTPFGGKKKDSCRGLVDASSVVLRIEVLGDEIVVDGASPLAPYAQGFERGDVARTGECAITLSIALQDLTMENVRLVFDGDRVTGSGKARVRMFEDGEAGENAWTCDAPEAPVIGVRVGN
jgi:hypothetical protein